MYFDVAHLYSLLKYDFNVTGTHNFEIQQFFYLKFSHFPTAVMQKNICKRVYNLIIWNILKIWPGILSQRLFIFRYSLPFTPPRAISIESFVSFRFFGFRSIHFSSDRPKDRMIVPSRHMLSAKV